MKWIRNILASLGWILAVPAIIYAFASFQPYQYAKPENPMPSVETIKSIRFIESTSKSNAEFIIPTNDFPMVSLLFAGSRKDSKPSKWVFFGDLYVDLLDCDTVRFELYTTHKSTGAFKTGEQYYRGGIDEQFKSVLTKYISNK